MKTVPAPVWSAERFAREYPMSRWAIDEYMAKHAEHITYNDDLLACRRFLEDERAAKRREESK